MTELRVHAPGFSRGVNERRPARSVVSPPPYGLTAHSSGVSVKRFEYEIRPGAAARRALARTFGCVRVVYNDYLALNQAEYAAGNKFVSAYTAMRTLLTEAKRTPERAWLSEVSNIALQQAILQGERAYKNFFDSHTGKRPGPKMGFPKFRSRKTRTDSFALHSGGFRIRGGWKNTRKGGGRLNLTKIGSVPVIWSRPLPAQPTSVTIKRRPDGRYFASFVVDAPVAPRPVENPGQIVGIDVGLTDFVTVVNSGGNRHKIRAPKFLRASEHRLARAQRTLARKQRGSHNRDRARLRVARLHQHVKNQRRNHAWQIATTLIRENQTLSVETLSIRGMAATRGKSIHDAGWGVFLTILEQLAAEHSRDLFKADRHYPSTRTCSVCERVGEKQPLHVREWTCAGCGSSLDRDYNAAVNLMVAAGLAETENACGREVRRGLAQPEHAHPVEARTRPTLEPAC